MQQPAQGGVLSTEMRHAMLAHIYQSINGTVRAVGRSEDAIQKYAQNIEVRLWYRACVWYSERDAHACNFV